MVPQVFNLFRSKLEHEILWKTLPIPFYGAIQRFSLYTVKHSQIGIQHNLMPTDQKNLSFYSFNKNRLIHCYTHVERSSARY